MSYFPNFICPPIPILLFKSMYMKEKIYLAVWAVLAILNIISLFLPAVGFFFWTNVLFACYNAPIIFVIGTGIFGKASIAEVEQKMEEEKKKEE